MRLFKVYNLCLTLNMSAVYWELVTSINWEILTIILYNSVKLLRYQLKINIVTNTIGNVTFNIAFTEINL